MATVARTGRTTRTLRRVPAELMIDQPSASFQISFVKRLGAGQTGAVTRSSEGETLLRCARRIRRPA